MIRLRLAALAATAFLVGSHSVAQPPRLSDVAQVWRRPPGAPKYSDVMFSSRWPRPLTKDDPYDTFEAAKKFHATRIDWNYPGTDVEFIQKVKSAGYPYFGTINSELPDVPGGRKKSLGRDRDVNGSPVGNPNLDFLQQRGDVAAREYRDVVLAHLKLLIDGGADGIHVDDPGMTYSNTIWEGGGYGRASMDQFRSWLGENTTAGEQTGWRLPVTLDDFDYAAWVRSQPDDKAPAPAQVRKLFLEFHRRTLDDFYEEIRAAIDEHAGRHVPFTCNNGSPQWQDFPYLEHFDYWIGETSVRYGNPTAKRIYEKVAQARALGRAQYFSPLNDSLEYVPDRKTYVATMRRVIAASYACGSATIVPWDVWRLGTDRFFGTYQEFGDLYRTVSEHPRLFDDHEEVFAVGKDIQPRLAEGLTTPPVRIVPAAKNVLVTVRAVPGKKTAPIVIHLVDWADHPEPFDLLIHNESCGGSADQLLDLELMPSGKKPTPLKATLDGTGHTHIALPSLTPWALIVVRSKPDS